MPIKFEGELPNNRKSKDFRIANDMAKIIQTEIDELNASDTETSTETSNMETEEEIPQKTQDK